MTRGMCSTKHNVLVMSSLTKLQSLRSGPRCQSRQLGQVEFILRAGLSTCLLAGRCLSQWEPPICQMTAVTTQHLHTFMEIRALRVMGVLTISNSTLCFIPSMLLHFPPPCDSNCFENNCNKILSDTFNGRLFSSGQRRVLSYMTQFILSQQSDWLQGRI